MLDEKGGSLKTDQREPTWVTEMHEHFQQTGAFRAEDLERVLGNPRESVGVQAATGFGSFLPRSE
jgi:hypothetical protein